MNNYVEFNVLAGKVFTSIEVDKEEEYIKFTDTSGSVFIMKHEQECCENVYIESIVGDISDLLNTPIVMAEEASGYTVNGTATWTFYKLATIKGYVDIRWYGESNGYYSESVSLIMV